jgi:hypothetical protein
MSGGPAAAESPAGWEEWGETFRSASGSAAATYSSMGVVLTVIVAALHLASHLRRYSRPRLQRHVVRIIFMTPIYACCSYLTLRTGYRWPNVLRDVYEVCAVPALPLARAGCPCVPSSDCRTESSGVARALWSLSPLDRPWVPHHVRAGLGYLLLSGDTVRDAGRRGCNSQPRQGRRLPAGASICLHALAQHHAAPAPATNCSGRSTGLLLCCAQLPRSWFWGTCCIDPLWSSRISFLKFCKAGTLQFALLKPLCAAAQLVLQGADVYAEGEYLRFDRGFVYIALVYNISISLSIYALVRRSNAACQCRHSLCLRSRQLLAPMNAAQTSHGKSLHTPARLSMQITDPAASWLICACSAGAVLYRDARKARSIPACAQVRLCQIGHLPELLARIYAATCGADSRSSRGCAKFSHYDRDGGGCDCHGHSFPGFTISS